jgi:hypothetical protein
VVLASIPSLLSGSPVLVDDERGLFFAPQAEGDDSALEKPEHDAYLPHVEHGVVRDAADQNGDRRCQGEGAKGALPRADRSLQQAAIVRDHGGQHESDQAHPSEPGLR